MAIACQGNNRREQWNARIKIVVISTSLSFLLGVILYGPFGVLLVSVIALTILPFSYNAYKYGREKAIEDSEQPPRLP